MALGKASSCIVAHEIAVIIVGRNQAQGAEKKSPCGRSQQIGSADDFCNLHRGIVDDDS